MECYENREMRQIRTGFFLMAAVMFAGGLAVAFVERAVQEARFTKALIGIYGELQAEELLAVAGKSGYGGVWLFSLIAMAAFLSCFFYMTGKLSGICREIRRFSLCLEQMTAGRAVSLAEWKEGVLAALSNQAELLYLRNRHMTKVVQEEKEELCRFMENMAHQMKTPLTAIRLDLDLMEIGIGFQKKLEDCSRQCDRLQESVQEFLSAGRLAAGRLKLILRPARVEDILEGACTELAPVLEKRGIHVKVASESELPLFCDYNWMKEAVLNLLKNSAESMDEGGAIEIRHWDERGWKCLEFLDESGGISGEESRHMFERFYTGRQEKGGTGLGLSIAKEVVEASHGSISVSSAAGGKGRKAGARFLMKFRILDGPEAYE
ncbi:MAG: HAMP domain-containing histidine kinase [Lachnospiraceae bacterium]|nr:HAMP domain-containing histidine kinase [Lachnospiraceae bacterium]